MNELMRRGSLGRRVFFALIVGELLFALVLGVTIGVFSTLSDVRQREEALRQISSTIAAGLMPMIADQQITHVEAQLSSILETADARDVMGICIRDGSGTQIACEGVVSPSVAEVGQKPSSPLAVFFDEQRVVQPVVVDGLRVATVTVQFRPPGLATLIVPGVAALLVLLSVIVVSLPWTAWQLSSGVVEPLDDLGAFAARIAEGDLDAEPPSRGRGEIGVLQATLSRMAQQLKDRDEELRGSYHDLEAAYEYMQQAKEEIEQLSTVKSNFVAVAAHEIRGPLTTINLYAELLEAGELGRLGEPAEEAVEAIFSAASRLRTIVSDLMDSALLERGLLPISFSDVWLVTLIDEAMRDNGTLADKTGARITIDGEVPDISVPGDPLRLRQVLDNLLSNALKYSPPGSPVTIAARADNEWVEIDVVDRGRGIPQGGQKQLFAMFGRVDFGDSRDTAGLGLGLAISARIVEAHGGQISYRANEGGTGSIFTVRVPARRADSMPASISIKVAEAEADE